MLGHAIDWRRCTLSEAACPTIQVQAYPWLVEELRVEALDADPHNQWAQQNRDLLLRQMTAEQRSQIQSAE